MTDDAPDRWQPCGECGKPWPPELLTRLGGACSPKCANRRAARERYRRRVTAARGGTDFEDVRRSKGRPRVDGVHVA